MVEVAGRKATRVRKYQGDRKGRDCAPNSYDWESAYRSGVFKHWESDHPSPELVALVAAGLLEASGKVLDVGCGGGLDAIFLAKCGFKVVGIDISATALNIARKRARRAYVSVSWREGNILEMPIADGSTDFINDRGVFHIVEEVDRPQYGAELFRVLKPGGIILIRGASEPREEQFNPVTAKAIDKHFPPSRFSRGPVLPLPLMSVAGVMRAKIAVLRKVSSFS
jgi:ubiquinone/menaquinone biosynthesis C-methylase UbiE